MGQARRNTLLTTAGTAHPLPASRPGRVRFGTPLMVVGIAVIAYVIWTASSRPPRSNQATDPADPISGLLARKPDPEPSAKPDASKPNVAAPTPPARPETKPGPIPVELTAPRQRPQVGPAGTHIERSAETTVQWADKADPGRIAGEFRYTALEPLEVKRYLVTNPRTWMYAKDGWAIYIQSDSGRVYIPDEQSTRRPESGTLRGNVIIKAFKPRADRSRPDPEKDQAYLTARTDSLLFDGAVGELSTPDRIVADWPQGSFAGRGLTAVFNELKNRIDYAEVREGEELILRPSAREKAAAAPVASAPAPAPAATQPATGAAPPPAVAASPAHQPAQTLYHAVFTSDVRITQAQRIFTSDQLEFWTRLLDGRFADDAFGPHKKPAAAAAAISPADPAVPPSAASNSPAASAPLADLPPDSTGPAKPDPNSADIRVTWTGPFKIVTSDTPFQELENDSVVARFTSPRTGIVSGTDVDAGATIRCASLDYFATRRKIHVEGPGASGVSLAVENSGKILASNLTADLLKTSAHISGSGSLDGVAGFGFESTQAPRLAPPSVQWTQQADFVFDQARGKPVLHEAIFTGDVQAKDQNSQLRADFVRAEFVPASAEATPLLSRLTLQNHAFAADGAGGEIAADHLDARFASIARPGKPAATAVESLIARGDVSARRAGQSIQSGYLESHFASKEGKNLVATTVLARDQVILNADGDVRAFATELKADVPAQMIDLTGSVGAPAQASKGPTQISGVLMRMDGVARTLNVSGPGRLDHVEPAKSTAAQDSKISATWTSSLAFDDRLGTAALAGDVVTTWLPDPLSTDLLKSQALALAFTPFAEPASAPGGARPPQPPRELLALTADGTATVPASLESRRFAIPAPDASTERIPERITYLEGRRILADNFKGTLDVPGAGKLLISDRRPGAVSRGTGSFGGDALFRWTDSLAVRRAAESADMSGNVEVIHLRPGDENPTEMHAQKVNSTFRRPAGSPGPATQSGTRDAELSMRGEIVRLIATGAVWARSTTKREVNADLMDYDAINGMIVLSADGGREIQAFDPATATPIRGKLLEWDLKQDRIRLKDVGGITAPR